MKIKKIAEKLIAVISFNAVKISGQIYAFVEKL